MKIFHTTAVAAFVMLPGLAAAQGFTGADLSASMLGLTSDTNVGAASYEGGLQFGIVPGIAIEADIARHNFRGEDGNSSSYTLHATYDIGFETTAGIYIGQDKRDAGNTDVYGIEGASAFGGVEVNGFFGRYDGTFGTGTMMGVNGAFPLTAEFTATGRAGLVNGVDDMTSAAIGGEYQVFGGPSIFAEVGRSDFDGNGDTFVTLGAKIAVGNGTTFSGRGITDLFPNF